MANGSKFVYIKTSALGLYLAHTTLREKYILHISLPKFSLFYQSNFGEIEYGNERRIPDIDIKIFFCSNGNSTQDLACAGMYSTT